VRRQLAFDPRFHDSDRLIESIPAGMVDHRELPALAAAIQEGIETSQDLERYTLELWQAVRDPAGAGIEIADVDMQRLVAGGASPRGMSYLLRAARVAAWLDGRHMVVPEDLRAVEDRVNEHVLSAQPVVIYEDVPLDEARAMGAMALFGEKYADRVRVVQIGDMAPEIASFSRELCGGIHVPNTGAIGQFRIRHEGSAASGIRRITAVCGRAALQMAQADTDCLQAAAHRLKTSPAELLTAIDRTLDTLREERRKREQMAATGVGQAEATETPVAGVTLKRLVLKSGEAEDAKRAADRLVDNAPLAVVVVGIAIEGKVQFVAKIGAAAQAQGAHAGNLVRELAKLTGGGGGGRADFATAGGRDATQLDAAMAAAEGLLQAQLGA
ncbi:MAG: DHHA1 domain-containing protein, partial [Fimbriimonadaceae bacterium]